MIDDTIMNQKTITKADIVDRICQDSRLERSDALRYVNDLIKIMIKVIHDDGYLQIHRFGRFDKYTKAARKGRNPQTGEDLILAERNIVLFRISIILKNKLKLSE